MLKEETQPINLFSASANGAKVIPMTLKKQAMGKIMGRLTDLYKEPIQATVRETVSNALDATAVLINQGESVKPVEIHSPSRLNPNFVVRDHGVGMTPLIIEKVLAEYGASTKELDDQQTGSHGFGAKSPLAYVKEFFIETTRDGYTSKVSVSRNENGPLTEIIQTIKTDQPSGTVVTVPIPLYNESTREKFNLAIDYYRNYAFTMGQSIVVDGKIQKENSNYYYGGEITLHEESGRKGRFWINLRVLREFLSMLKKQKKTFSASDFYKSVGYALSGFGYSSPSRYTRIDEALFLVELSPKLLNFSPSRDDIIHDEHFEVFENQVFNELLHQDAFYKSVLSYYRSLDKEDAYRLFSELSFAKSENPDEFLLNYVRSSYDNVLPEHTVAKIEDFTTVNGYNPLMENQKHQGKNHFLGKVSNTGSSYTFTDFYRSDYDAKYENKEYVQFALNISKVKEHLVKNFERNEENFSLVDSSFLIPTKSKLPSIHESTVIISVDSVKDISFAWRNRNHLGDVSHLFFVKGSVDEDFWKFLVYRNEILASNVSLQYLTIESIKQKVSEAKKQQTEDNNPSFRFKEYKDTISSQMDILTSSFTEERLTKDYTIEELIVLKPIIVVLSRKQYQLSKSVLNGAYEKYGEELFGRKILEINTPKKGFYEALESHADMLMTDKKYAAKSAVEKRVLSERRFERSVNEDIVRTLSLKMKEKAALLYFVAEFNQYTSVDYIFNYEGSYAFNTKINQFRKWLDKVSGESIDSAAETIESILSYDGYSKDETAVSNLYISQIVEDFSPESLRLLSLYATLVREVGSRDNFLSNKRNSCERELSLLLNTYSNTASDSFRSVVVERVDEIIGENIR